MCIIIPHHLLFLKAASEKRKKVWDEEKQKQAVGRTGKVRCIEKEAKRGEECQTSE